jgi:hypothetical protein
MAFFKFVEERECVSTLKKAIVALQEGKPFDYVAEFTRALTVCKDMSELGLLFDPTDGEAVVRKVTASNYGVRCGYPLIDNIFYTGFAPGWLIVPLAPPKSCKCLGKGTEVLMFDGSVKKVEDIKVGDFLMGDDSTPRKVTQCESGHGSLYRVDQNTHKSFICNDAHILCLRSPQGQVIEMRADEYAAKKPYFRRIWKCYSDGVDFEYRPVPLDPYYFGLWIGDGSKYGPSISVGQGDIEVEEFLKTYANQLGLATSETPGQGCKDVNYTSHWAGNPALMALQNLSLIKNKHFPEVYKINSRSIRLQVLAGLIDSDGHLEKYGYVIVSSNQNLAIEYKNLAQSLGFISNIYYRKTEIKSIGFNGEAWCVTILGKLSQIPVKLARKKAKDSVRKSDGRHWTRITPVGPGDYYGFEIDNNCRFLLSDYIVTHNTTLCLNFAYNIISPAVDEDCIYNTCEISEELAFLRELCRLIRLPIASVYQNPELFIQMMHTAFSRSNFRSKLLFKGWSAGQATISDFKTHAMVLKGQGLEPRAMIIDFAETVKPSKTEGEVLDRRQQANIYTDARALGSDVGLAVFMPDRCNVETVSRAVPNMTSFQGAFQKGGIVDVAFGICMTEIEKINNIFRLFFFLNRHGPSMQYFRGLLDLETYRMEVNEEIEYVPDEDDKVGKAHVRTKRGQQGHLPQELQE